MMLSEPLKDSDETELCVSGNSDANRIANAIISVVLGRGQAVMKAGGSAALHVAMAAIINARHRLKKRGVDIMAVPRFITEDTSASLGRESKFIKFNLLRCQVNGPLVDPADPSSYGSCFGDSGSSPYAHSERADGDSGAGSSSSSSGGVPASVAGAADQQALCGGGGGGGEEDGVVVIEAGEDGDSDDEQLALLLAAAAVQHTPSAFFQERPHSA